MKSLLYQRLNLDLYLFVPANSKKFLEGLNKYHPDYFVIDLEDSVPKEQLQNAISNIVDLIHIPLNAFIRMPSPFVSDLQGLNFIFQKFSLFVLPKVETINQVLDFLNLLSQNEVNLRNVKLIISIESPKGILNLINILNKCEEFIEAIIFGSHDYCESIFAQYEGKSYEWARDYILNVSHAYGKGCIDIASTNITDCSLFKEECIDGFRKGFSGKPALHPIQLLWASDVQYFTDEEMDFAFKVLGKKNRESVENFSPLISEGKIVEKPHLGNLFRIYNFKLKRNRHDS